MSDTLLDARDEIARLQARVDRLRQALFSAAQSEHHHAFMEGASCPACKSLAAIMDDDEAQR